MPPKKRVKSKKPVRENPFLMGYDPLPFDEVEEEDLMALTDEQAADVFLADWMARFNPYVTYKAYIQRSEHRSEVLMHQVKVGYINFVLEEDWEEEKYEVVLDSIFVSPRMISTEVIRRQGDLYEKGQLPMQLAKKRAERRRL